MQSENNCILITGGGSGIGRGLAEAFHTWGNQVIIAGRSRAKLEETAAANPGMAVATLDVTDATDIERFAREIIEQHPSLNVLINNAGMMQVEDVTNHDLSVAEDTITTNLLGPIRLTSALLGHLRAKPHAAVLNVTSGLAYVPMEGTPTYSATKAALHSYTISLREQLRGSSVEVIEIIPPYVQTHLTGEQQANDPRAMPLDEYIRDTMQILLDKPDAEEVVIERVAPLRFAEARGAFNETLAQVTAMSRERAAATNRG